jgi:hypothetical protein
MGTGMQLVEIRLAVLPSPNRFPVHDDGADPKGPQRLDYPRILAGPIVASARVEPDPIALTSGHQSVAVVLDFVDPCRPAGSLLAGAGEAGGYETRTRNTHGGPIEAPAQGCARPVVDSNSTLRTARPSRARDTAPARTIAVVGVPAQARNGTLPSRGA